MAAVDQRSDPGSMLRVRVMHYINDACDEASRTSDSQLEALLDDLAEELDWLIEHGQRWTPQDGAA